MIGTKVLEERRSKYNGNLRVVKTLGMGTYIQSNGLTQSGGIVETIWKQTLRKVKGKRQEVSNVLILGLGGGTIAKLIKRNWKDSKVTGVEIDSTMIDLGEKYLGLDKSKIQVIIKDAFLFIQKNKVKYDLIVVDLYNGDTFPKKFEKEEYIKLIKTHLIDEGTVIINRLYYGDKRPMAVKFGNKLKKIFSEVEWFYPEANLMFLCSK